MISVASKGAKTVHLADVLEGTPLCGARLHQERRSVATTPTCRTCLAVARDRKESGRHGYNGRLEEAPFPSVKIARGSGGRADFQVIVPFGATQRQLREVGDLALAEFVRLEQQLGN